MVEALERRDVLSAATFAPFATLPGQVTTAGTPAEVALHFSAGQITSSGSPSILVGFYVESASGSNATPQISEVDGPMGSLTRVALPKRGGVSPSKSLFITYLNTSTAAAQDITVDVVEPGNQVGNFTLKAFLPGDANGDGKVDQADVASVKAAYGTALGQANNNPAADFNADGHVGCIDLRLTQMNLGAQLAYTPPSAVAATSTPVILANPIPAIPATMPAVVPTPIPTTTPAASVAPAVTPITQPVAITTTTSSASSAGSAASAGAASSTGSTSTAASSTAATTATTTTLASSVPTPVPAETPIVLGAPYLAYIYPQTGEIVPVPAPISANPTAAMGTPVYYYGQPVVQSPGYVQASAPIASYPTISQPFSVPAAPLAVYYSNSQASAQAVAR